MAKRKILLASYTVPENRMGGALLLYRHFILKNDFEIGIVTNNPAEVHGVFYRHLPEPALLRRLKRTRLHRYADDYTELVHARLFDRRLYAVAREFEPDLIFNVAETYFSYHAQMLARRLNIPFVSYFMDWASFATSTHGWALPEMDRMYRRLYRQADLALCISEGMKKELGSHPNAHVVYPTGAEIKTPEIGEQVDKQPFVFCFAGNMDRWYGKMVHDLICAAEGEMSVALKIFGGNHQWPESFAADQRAKGVFRGFLPFEKLIPEFQAADAFVLPMGFGPEAALIERTSFKTKLLDYILFDKPMLIWGPEYSTAVEVARKYDCGFCVTDPSPKAALAGMKELAKNRSLRETLVRNARNMKETEFNPGKIHLLLKIELEKLIPQ